MPKVLAVHECRLQLGFMADVDRDGIVRNQPFRNRTPTPTVFR